MPRMLPIMPEESIQAAICWEVVRSERRNARPLPERRWRIPSVRCSLARLYPRNDNRQFAEQQRRDRWRVHGAHLDQLLPGAHLDQLLPGAGAALTRSIGESGTASSIWSMIGMASGSRPTHSR